MARALCRHRSPMGTDQGSKKGFFLKKEAKTFAT
jgi:hypothetical protein